MKIEEKTRPTPPLDALYSSSCVFIFCFTPEETRMHFYFRSSLILSLTDSVACSSKAAPWCDYYDLFFSYTSSPSLVDSWLANEMQINVSPALLFVPQSAAHLIKRLKLLDIQEWRFCCFCRHPGEYSGRTCCPLPVEMESSCCCSSRRQRRRECCVCQFWGEHY